MWLGQKESFESSHYFIISQHSIFPKEFNVIPIVSIVRNIRIVENNVIENRPGIDHRRQGYRIATGKNQMMFMGFLGGPERKDSWRTKQAGAHTPWSSHRPEGALIRRCGERSDARGNPGEMIQDVDLIGLGKGIKKMVQPKIEIFPKRRNIKNSSAPKEDNLIAIVSRQEVPPSESPASSWMTSEGVADFIEKKYLRSDREGEVSLR